MRDFARLFERLDQTTKTNNKVAALFDYFTSATAEDVAWAVFFLTGNRFKAPVKHAMMVQWAIELAEVPAWLFQECYDAVGDFAETVANVLPSEGQGSGLGLSHWAAQIEGLGYVDDNSKRATLHDAWRQLDPLSRFVYNKLLTGGFRVGVSQELVHRALSQAVGIEKSVIAHRLMGKWRPGPQFIETLRAAIDLETDSTRPYPFCLAHPLQVDLDSLGSPADWTAEWKWDGIRCQLVRRRGKITVWSRGEEIVNESFPDIAQVGDWLPDGTVVDGEILAWSEGKALPFQSLQRRLGRKAPGKKLLGEVPASLVAFDLLESNGTDLRDRPFAERRKMLDSLVESTNHDRLVLSPTIDFDTWTTLTTKRSASSAMRAEGLMIKSNESVYEAGRKRGPWWKWKVDPFVVDAVLVTAQRGSGKRASLYTDYTFAIWSDGQLVPFAKAYSGLTDEEIRQVDSFVRRNTQDKFGPVRTVKPELVFEIAFEGIQLSKRHKSGLAVRFPRIARWRKDKQAVDADRVETVKALLQERG